MISELRSLPAIRGPVYENLAAAAACTHASHRNLWDLRSYRCGLSIGAAAGLGCVEVQILAIHDAARRRTHVRQLLSTRIDEVRAQIAELITLEGHLHTQKRRTKTNQDLAVPSCHRRWSQTPSN